MKHYVYGVPDFVTATIPYLVPTSHGICAHLQYVLHMFSICGIQIWSFKISKISGLRITALKHQIASLQNHPVLGKEIAHLTQKQALQWILDKFALEFRKNGTKILLTNF